MPICLSLTLNSHTVMNKDVFSTARCAKSGLGRDATFAPLRQMFATGIICLAAGELEGHRPGHQQEEWRTKQSMDRVDFMTKHEHPRWCPPGAPVGSSISAKPL